MLASFASTSWLCSGVSIGLAAAVSCSPVGVADDMLSGSRRAFSKLGGEIESAAVAAAAAPIAASSPNSRREMRVDFVPAPFASLLGAPELLPKLSEDEFDTEV